MAVPKIVQVDMAFVEGKLLIEDPPANHGLLKEHHPAMV
jgi:hypothetical protein